MAAAAAAVPPLRAWQLERSLSAAASHVAGLPMQVRCQGLGRAFVDAGNAAGHLVEGADGVMERTAHLDFDICRRLREYIGKDGSGPTAAEVIGVHVLTHEARHVAGVRDEAVAECQAVQRDALTARALGASEQEAHDLAQEYWRSHYPRMGAGYRSPECAPGRALVEGLDVAPWAPVPPARRSGG